MDIRDKFSWKGVHAKKQGRCIESKALLKFSDQKMAFPEFCSESGMIMFY